ncbi:hypothetical protein BDF19DRAFT_311232 [Syncephalis fuscata]|nr:hypothetical protein BDF19DRAFT_311232 [Syncephalis fuscata]
MVSRPHYMHVTLESVFSFFHIACLLFCCNPSEYYLIIYSIQSVCMLVIYTVCILIVAYVCLLIQCIALLPATALNNNMYTCTIYAYAIFTIG